MIKTNGYYIDLPRYYEDYVAGNKVFGYHHYAFYFKNNGDFLISYKNNKSKLEESFTKKDFLEDQKNQYEIIGIDKLKLIFNYDKEWKHEHILKILDETSIKDEDRILNFKMWNKN